MTIWSAPSPQANTMTEPAKASEIHLRAVRLWLLAAAAMIFLTLVVGGATRPDGIWSLDRGVEAGHRCPASTVRE